MELEEEIFAHKERKKRKGNMEIDLSHDFGLSKRINSTSFNYTVTASTEWWGVEKWPK